MSYNRVHAVVTALLAQAAIAVAYGQTAQLEEIVVTAQRREEREGVHRGRGISQREIGRAHV